MGCLVNLIKIFLGLILIVIMLIVGYKLIFDPSTFQKPGVEMELTPELERGLVYVIKVFKAVFGQDKCVISILSTHEEFYSIQKKRKRLYRFHKYAEKYDARPNAIGMNFRLEPSFLKDGAGFDGSSFEIGEHTHGSVMIVVPYEEILPYMETWARREFGLTETKGSK